MKPAAREDFFDVLLDRLVKDVATDLAKRFNLEPAESASGGSGGDPGQERARIYELDSTDLAARVLDWRVRTQSSSLTNPKTVSQSALTSTRMLEIDTAGSEGVSARVRAESEEQKALQDPWIALRSAKSLLSLRILERDGVAFTARERIFHDAHVSVQERALRRERRRILMKLHPDRFDAQTLAESEQRRIHERFLAAHEAFEIIFAEIEEITQSANRERNQSPAAAANSSRAA